MKGVRKRVPKDAAGPLEGGSVRAAYRIGLLLSLVGGLAVLAPLVALAIGHTGLASTVASLGFTAIALGGGIVLLTTELEPAD